MEPQAVRVPRTAKSDKHIAGLYDMEHSLGSGHFAVVKLARHVFTGEKVAVKVIDKTKLDDVAKSHLYQEVRCMKLVQHPNIVRLYEVIDTQTKLYLILEYGDGGDMYDHIIGKGISEMKACHYFKQILSAIDYCHRLHVVHRDLKPENVIFFKTNDIAKLTDFGFSNNFLPGEKLFTSCGSLAYSAPEILLGDSYDAPAVDVWSLGVILYMMLVGNGPFNHSNDSETLTMIMDCKYQLPDTLSPLCKSLISRMLVRKPSDRASLESILSDPWVNSLDTPPSTNLKPLICEVSITSEVHAIVLQKMEKGEISTREEIEKSLAEKNYNHIAATYFLLAERVLKRRHSGALHVKLESTTSCPKTETYRTIKLEQSMLEEPSEETDENLPIINDLTREHSQSDECLNTSDSTTTSNEFEITPLQNRAHRMTYPNAIYNNKTKSSPNLALNEISEEHESELDDSPRASPILQRRASQRRRKYHTTCRLSPIHSRKSSCSSSDDDEMHLMTERRRISSLGQMPESSTTTTTKSEKNQTKSTSEGKQISDTVNEDDVRNIDGEIKTIEANIANFLLLAPEVSLKLSRLGAAYTPFNNRHFSDTNLLSYSLQLQLALAQKKRYELTKSSSENNLDTIASRKSLSNKDLFCKKRKSGSTKSGSTLSLSVPIEEEPSDSLTEEPPSMKPLKSSSFTELSLLSTNLSKIRKQVSDSDLPSRYSVSGACYDRPIHDVLCAYRSRQLMSPTASQIFSPCGSVCCSLV